MAHAGAVELGGVVVVLEGAGIAISVATAYFDYIAVRNIANLFGKPFSFRHANTPVRLVLGRPRLCHTEDWSLGYSSLDRGIVDG